MLESIRASAQSFGVKLAFGVIILVFVFWGIGNFNDRDYSNVVAMVNGEPIVAQEFERAYLQAEEYILRNNKGITREQLIKDHLGRQVLRELIQATLLRQEAARAGIAVTPLELRLAVGKMPAFQDDKGNFDPAAYKRHIENSRGSAAQYEAGLRNELLQEKALGLVTAPAWIDPDEARNRFNYLREQRLVDYVFLPAKTWQEQMSVDDAEIQQWYDAQQSHFAVPAKADVSYIIVRPEALVDASDIPEADLRAWYEANKADYEKPEEVSVRHILVEVGEDADDAAQKAAQDKLAQIQAALASGAPFAEVADQYNSENAAGPGGELGWIRRGQTVPAFEEAAFLAQPGKITEPVRSPFGWHIILVEEKREAGVEPFEKAAADARAALAHDLGLEKIHETLDTLIEDNILAKPLAESAAKFNLKDGRTGMMSRDELVQTLGISQDAAQTLLDSPAGAPLDTALEAGDQYVIARIEETVPSGVKPLAEVREEITAILKNEKAAQKAMTEAAELLKKITANGQQAIADAKLELVKGKEVGRGGTLPGFAPNSALNETIFATEAGKWLPAPYMVNGENGEGALVGMVEKIVLPDQQEFENLAGLLGRALNQERKEDLFNLFIQQLADQARIEITNQNLVDRVNM